MVGRDLALDVPNHRNPQEKNGFHYRGIKLGLNSLMTKVEMENMVVLKNKIYTGIVKNVLILLWLSGVDGVVLGEKLWEWLCWQRMNQLFLPLYCPALLCPMPVNPGLICRK